MTHRTTPHRTTMYPGYDVGYGKPPRHSRFQKGQSGNPGGRKRGMTEERAKRLALKEAYRKLNVQEGDGVTPMPAMQAIMRSQVALAAKGNGPAQRAVIKVVQEIEKELAAIAAARAAEEERRREPMSDAEAIRRIAYLLNLPEYDKKAREWHERLKKDEQEAEERIRAMRAADAAKAAANPRGVATGPPNASPLSAGEVGPQKEK
jgi:hypothetical protein